MIYPYQGVWPTIHPSAFITDQVTIVGDVTIGEDVSIWFGTVIRGDVAPITIGRGTNIQDNCTLHVTWNTYPLVLGEDVTVGHAVTLHGCTIGDRALLGMGAVILDAAVVEPESLVAAGTLVREKFVVPTGRLVAGVPGKVVRELTDKEKAYLPKSATNYRHYVDEYRRHADLEQGMSVDEYFTKRERGERS